MGLLGHELMRNWLKWLILLVIVAFCIEIGSAFIYRITIESGDINKQDLKPFFIKYNTDYEKLQEEFKVLSKNCLFHPYRWYASKKFSGKYVKIDEDGWRIDRSQVPKDIRKIACFGGSTMFSMTADSGTIPYHLNSRLDSGQIMALNFGVGGYSSTSELMAFIEVMRYEKNVKCAIFYDGVNEVYRYIEYKQHDPERKLFSYMGYPYPLLLEKGMRNHLNVIDFREYLYIPYSLRLCKQIYYKISKPLTSKELINDYDREAEFIANIYINNIKDIADFCKAKKIMPIFILQPNIFTVNQNMLTEREKNIFNFKFADVDLEKLTKSAYKRILQSDELKKVNFYNLSDALDQRPPGDYFMDNCHLFDNGNKIVAEKILSILNNYLPQSYIK